MTQAVNQTLLAGVQAKAGAKAGKRGDPAAFGLALNGAGAKGKQPAKEPANDAPQWQRSAVAVRLAAVAREKKEIDTDLDAKPDADEFSESVADELDDLPDDIDTEETGVVNSPVVLLAAEANAKIATVFGAAVSAEVASQPAGSKVATDAAIVPDNAEALEATTREAVLTPAIDTGRTELAIPRQTAPHLVDEGKTALAAIRTVVANAETRIEQETSVNETRPPRTKDDTQSATDSGSARVAANSVAATSVVPTAVAANAAAKAPTAETAPASADEAASDEDVALSGRTEAAPTVDARSGNSATVAAGPAAPRVDARTGIAEPTLATDSAPRRADSPAPATEGAPAPSVTAARTEARASTPQTVAAATVTAAPALGIAIASAEPRPAPSSRDNTRQDRDGNGPLNRAEASNASDTSIRVAADTSAPRSRPAADQSQPAASDPRPPTNSDPDGEQVDVRVTASSERALPTPAALGPAANASAIVAAISASPVLRSSIETLAQVMLRAPSNAAGEVQTLKIQLHPAELGSVTAQLRFADDQLSVELAVDNAEAYRRLSLDTDSIAKSLRSLGFEVDQVTVQQAPQSATAVARADVSAGSNGNFARDGSGFQSWNSSSGEGRLGGQGSGRGGENGGERRENGAPHRQGNPGSGIYI